MTIIILIIVVIVIFAGSTAFYLRPKEPSLLKDNRKFINLCKNKITYNKQEKLYVYTYSDMIYLHITQERLYIDNVYKKSREFKGTKKETIESRLRDIHFMENISFLNVQMEEN